MTLFHVQHKSVPKWTGRGHFVYWKCTSSPGSHPTEKCSSRKDLWAGFVLWEAFFILFCLFLFTMCHVKNKSCPGTSQNSNIICNIISIQMRYLNQSQSLLTMCHLVRTLKRVLLNNCSFLIFFFFFPITLTRKWHVSTYNTNLCSAQMNWARIGSAPRPSGSHPTENYSCCRDLLAGFVLWEAFFILFCLFSFYHVPR